MILTLTGFMGCGKSSVGNRLKDLLSCPFIDLDDYIEEKAARSIPEIFSGQGEGTFRRLEMEALLEILQEKSCRSYPDESCPGTLVLALGGGTVMTPANADLVRTRTVCVYLRAGIPTLLQHLSQEQGNRPMLQTSEELEKRITLLMEKRSPVYEETASFIVDVDGRSLDDIAEEIVRRLIYPTDD